MPDRVAANVADPAAVTAAPAVWFDADIASLFLVDDLALRADALRNAVVPRLADPVYAATARIGQVYGVDLRADSTLVRSPGAKDTRRTARMPYAAARAALGPKRVTGGWPGVRGPQREAREYLPFALGTELTANGFTAVISLGPWPSFRRGDYERILDRWLAHESVIRMLADYAGGAFLQYAGEAEGPQIRPLCDIFAALLDRGRVQVELRTEVVAFPVLESAADRAAHALVFLFPLYDLFLQVAAGLPDRLSALVERANAWLAHEETVMSVDGDPLPQDAPPSREALVTAGQRARALAALHASVGVSRRYDVLHRDGFRCRDCGRSPREDANVELHIDHWIPRSRGGTDDIDNLRTLCMPCNIGRSNRFVRDERVPS